MPLPPPQYSQTWQWKWSHGGGVSRINHQLWHQKQTHHSKKPTAQSIIATLYLTIGDQLRTSLNERDNWKEDTETLLQACSWVKLTTTPSNTPHNPGQLIFGVNMIFCQKVKIDWALLKKQRRDRVLTNNKKENETGRDHTYRVGNLVLIMEKTYKWAWTGNCPLQQKDPTRSLPNTGKVMSASDTAHSTKISPSTATTPTTIGTKSNSSWNSDVPFFAILKKHGGDYPGQNSRRILSRIMTFLNLKLEKSVYSTKIK